MDNITKEVMIQYKKVQLSNLCNMFDFHCVINEASELELYELASLEKKEYAYLLGNYRSLLKKFGLK